MAKTPAQVSLIVATLRERLHKEYGMFLDPELLGTLIASAIQSKAMEQIDAVIGTFSADELLMAANALSEMQVDEAKASLIRDKQ